MKKLRIARIVLSALFLAATAACFIFDADSIPAAVSNTRRLHMAPLYMAESAGVIGVWLLITLVWGRIYCSTVCPVGALQDLMLHLRRRIPALDKPFRLRRPPVVRHHVLVVYVICLVTGLTVVPLMLEPWFIAGNMTQLFGAGRMAEIWVRYGFPAAWGVVCGLLSIAVILPWALLRGREFCNSVCPLGTAMGYLSSRAAFQIAIDGDRCISCMRCQDNCRSSGIKVVSRYVDNSRCVRCFECVARCPQGAIRYTQERRRPASPLFGRVRQLKGQ